MNLEPTTERSADAKPAAKKRKSGSPTQRTLAMLRRQGWTAAVSEHWNQYARIRQDLFGIIDVVALTGERIIGVQTTSATNVSARRRKIVGSPEAARWVQSGGRLFIHGWRKKGARWECREVEITSDDFEGVQDA